jgi:predicted transposase/invertase (TIGR01784 family)
MTTLPIDHDRLFKDLISTFFLEFLELFVPTLASLIEPDSITFREQEYFADWAEGETNIVDLLAEVKLAGDDATILVHVEPQATGRTVFPQRMFFYFSRLHQKHLKRIYPIALFSYDEPYKAADSSYSVEVADFKVLEFNFKVVQLNRLDWRDFISQPNPVAAALMAKMRIEERDRPKVKAECLRLLVTLQLNPAKTQLISQFVDSYLRLNQTEEEVFQTEIDTMGLDQKEAIMQTLTSWEERGMEKGVEQGQRSLVSLLLEQKFSDLPEHLNKRVNTLSLEQLKDLAIALLRFESLDDLTAWLADRS